jgi:hypothetical protein
MAVGARRHDSRQAALHISRCVYLYLDDPDRDDPAGAPCQAEETCKIRSTASFKIAVDDAKENRT